MAGIELRRISKSFGAVEVIADLSLNIASGEFAVLLGPSGCGKTTILRMIAGLEEVSSGEILIEGTRVDQIAPGQRGVALVFQHYALYPHMSVKENMAFGLRNIGMGNAEIDRKIDGAARILEIEHLLARKPSQLSGGQKQRVAIGRAIVKEPKAFLFDEPLSNLDAALRSRTRIELARLHQRLKSTMIFVTHDQVEAMTMATRIVVMNKGKIEQVGTPMEIYRTPATRFVATFVGTPAMNVLPVKVAPGVNGRAAATLPDGSVVETAIPISALPSGEDVVLGARAEHIHPGGQIAAKAEVVERLGDQTLVYARLRDGTSLVYEDSGDSGVAVGDSVSIGFKPEQMHLFGADGRARRGS
ncbi:sn-glycerol-3-phosphate ABC transporter ATP-binding protein UgpC [Bosea sp. BK604]|uniref:ABC transporter ATP-binding protein n=1 Tax=Bosea sp. BK604 TaxID=2512180 RepID=UPI00104A0DCE|nr:sn-glycerol-3-phosphate ABC transporter ATP-binding protein UgpC [Bosea sp. BK604]TCR66430.1 carbohydrate ABC transporter ATP-binding protein (CUT1 family) [Bosea sp. BK604]